jgi:hypothetical protein
MGIPIQIAVFEEFPRILGHVLVQVPECVQDAGAAGMPGKFSLTFVQAFELLLHAWS